MDGIRRSPDRGHHTATFVISSEQLSRGELDDRVGIPSHHGFTKGELMPQRVVRGKVVFTGGQPYRFTSWSVQSSDRFGDPSGPISQQAPIEEHLAWLFDAINPAREALMNLAASSDAQLALSLVPWFDPRFSTNPGFQIPQLWIDLLAAVRGGVNLDMYIIRDRWWRIG